MKQLLVDYVADRILYVHLNWQVCCSFGFEMNKEIALVRPKKGNNRRHKPYNNIKCRQQSVI